MRQGGTLAQVSRTAPGVARSADHSLPSFEGPVGGWSIYGLSEVGAGRTFLQRRHKGAGKLHARQRTHGSAESGAGCVKICTRRGNAEYYTDRQSFGAVTMCDGMQIGPRNVSSCAEIPTACVFTRPGWKADKWINPGRESAACVSRTGEIRRATIRARAPACQRPARPEASHERRTPELDLKRCRSPASAPRSRPARTARRGRALSAADPPNSD